jgi:hypothetical protein
VSEFRVEIAGLQLELFNRVGRRGDGCVGADLAAAVDFDVVVDAVEADVILPEVDAIDGEIGAPGLPGVGTGVGRRRGRDSGGKLRQGDPIAAVERQIVHRFGIDGLTDGGILRLQERGGRGHCHFLFCAAPGRDGKGWLLRASLLATYSAALIFLTWTAQARFRTPHRPLGPADALWSEVFNGTADTYIVPADAGFNLLEDLSHRPLPLADYMKGDYLDLPLAGVDAHTAADMRSQEFTSFVDLQIVAGLAGLPEYRPQRTFLRFPRELRLDDLKNANAVLIGSVDSNPWAAIAENSANFRIVYHQAMEGATIVNAKPERGEAASYASHWNEPAHETFALIAFLPNLDGSGHLLLLQGLDVAGTQAAAETLFHPAAIAPILRQATRPDGSLHFFEVLLRATSLDSNSLGGQVIASRIY